MSTTAAWTNGRSFINELFNFSEIRYFDIHGKVTGLKSRAMTSPCGKIRIPINEPTDSKSQIQEYLDVYHGEGIQHIALATEDIYASVEQLRANGVQFMDVPDTYYDTINERIPGHHEALERLCKDRILIDGDPAVNTGLLLQIFTNTVIGPIFFEIIQRKGNEGFGEGNFQALFEAIERDQIERGGNLMPWINIPKVEGISSRQAHTDLPTHTFERELGQGRLLWACYANVSSPSTYLLGKC